VNRWWEEGEEKRREVGDEEAVMMVVVAVVAAAMGVECVGLEERKPQQKTVCGFMHKVRMAGQQRQ